LKKDFCPQPGSKIYFAAATAFAERINLKKKKVQISETHRGVSATLDNGYMIIDQKWYS